MQNRYFLTSHSIRENKKIVIRIDEVLGENKPGMKCPAVISIIDQAAYSFLLQDWQYIMLLNEIDRSPAEKLISVLRYGNYSERLFTSVSDTVIEMSGTTAVSSELVAQHEANVCASEQHSLF